MSLFQFQVVTLQNDVSIEINTYASHYAESFKQTPVLWVTKMEHYTQMHTAKMLNAETQISD